METIHKPFTSAILLAGGQGSRFGCCDAKQWFLLLGKTVLRRSVEIYAAIDEIDELILVVRAQDMERARRECFGVKKTIRYVEGGACRAESSKNGFSAISDAAELVLIADAARCLTHSEDIRRVISSAYENGAACAVARITDTVKQFSQDDFLEQTLNRDALCVSQTPQAMRVSDYRRALSVCQSLWEITDDCMLLEKIGVRAKAVPCKHPNPKLTSKDDAQLFLSILQKKGERSMSEIRVGHGYDVHRLAPGCKLILGGVEIPHSRGLLGHSDADVLLHAVMDAVLGALALGDIGRHFPDTSEEFRGISSVQLALRVAQMMRDRGATIGNIDATLVLEKPKVAPYINNMKKNLAFAFGCDTQCVNVKATTEEGLGFSGRMEGVSATAIVTLVFCESE